MEYYDGTSNSLYSVYHGRCIHESFILTNNDSVLGFGHRETVIQEF